MPREEHTEIEELSECDRILQVLAQIPVGHVCPYGEIARRAGLPGKSRYVGYVLKNLPPASKIPWHRVVNSQGKISFPKGSDKYLEQKGKLEQEGITLLNGKIKLKHYLWRP